MMGSTVVTLRKADLCGSCLNRIDPIHSDYKHITTDGFKLCRKCLKTYFIETKKQHMSTRTTTIAFLMFWGMTTFVALMAGV